MPMSLPIISIAPYVNRTDDNENERLATSAALHRACVEYGCGGLVIRNSAPVLKIVAQVLLSRHNLFRVQGGDG